MARSLVIGSRRHPNAELPVRPLMVAWFTVVHVCGVGGLVYEFMYPHLSTIAFAAVLFLFRTLAITAGAHRQASHGAYVAHPALKVLFVILFAGTMQSSYRSWVAYHRRHHRYSDTDRDPYSVIHGFWWAHMGWIFRTPPVIDPSEVKDLDRDRFVRWQDAYWLETGLFMALVVPTGIAALWGDAIGGLLFAGCFSLMVQYHATWSINSLAHMVGSHRYAPTGTARSCTILTFVNGGEHNHERHHLAPQDYRLGTKLCHVDYGAWFIYVCSLVGLAKQLTTVSEAEVVRRASSRNA